MNKKLFAGICAALVGLTAVTFSACSDFDDDDGHDFTILAVKEETVKDYNSMPVFRALAKETKKDVYWTYSTSAQYSNNTDPVGTKGIDAIYHAGFSNLQLYNYGRRGRIVAINDYLKYMPNFSAILDNHPDIREALKSPDGNIYSLPRVEKMGLKAYPNLLFLNKKWVEQLIDANNLAVRGLKKEDLVDGLTLGRSKFKAILQQFNDLDMDGNGDTKNEVPLAFVSGNWQGNESDLIASFGVAENTQHKTIIDGRITFTIEDENWFTAIKELNDWYNRKLIRATAFSQTQDEFLAKGQDGRYGAFYWWEKNTVVAEDKREDYILLEPLVDDDNGRTGKQYVGLSNELEVEKGECVILSSCKDIAGLLAYFDKFFEPEYSAQLNYGSIESGAFLSKRGENGMLIPNDDHGKQSADDFRMKNAPYGVVYLTDEVWGITVEMESRAKLRLEQLENYVKPYTYEKAEAIPNLNYTKDELDTLSKYEISLGKNITVWMSNSIISASAPTEADWQNFLKTNRTAIEEVKRVNQDAYNRYLAATGEDVN